MLVSENVSARPASISTPAAVAHSARAPPPRPGDRGTHRDRAERHVAPSTLGSKKTELTRKNGLIWFESSRSLLRIRSRTANWTIATSGRAAPTAPIAMPTARSVRSVPADVRELAEQGRERDQEEADVLDRVRDVLAVGGLERVQDERGGEGPAQPDDGGAPRRRRGAGRSPRQRRGHERGARSRGRAGSGGSRSRRRSAPAAAAPARRTRGPGSAHSMRRMTSAPTATATASATSARRRSSPGCRAGRSPAGRPRRRRARAPGPRPERTASATGCQRALGNEDRGGGRAARDQQADDLERPTVISNGPAVRGRRRHAAAGG